MFKNYLLTTLRSIRKNLTYSAINILGLGLGLATFFLLSIWIIDELSFDQFHEHADRLYRPSMEYSFGGQTAMTSVSPTALLPRIKKNFPEVVEGVRLFNPSQSRGAVLRVNEKLFEENKFYYADSTLFKVLSFPLLKGNPDKALTEPNSLVITEEMAKKYFGDSDALGQVIQVNNRIDFIVTGILKSIPHTSLYRPDFIASFSTLTEESKTEQWWSANYQTILLIAPGASIRALEEKFNEYLSQQPELKLPNKGDYVRYNFMKLTDIYLHSSMEESELVGNIQYVYTFGAVALLILLIACINYINLATAKAAERAKEVGVRKVVGAFRKQLFTQFLAESALVAAIGFGLAFIIAPLTMPFFNFLTGKAFDFGSIFNIRFAALCIVLFVIITLLAGAYPALAITSFKPMSILRGNFKTSARGIWLRKSLVVFQFLISLTLIISTLVVDKQLSFIQSKPIGFDRDNVIVIPLDRKSNEQFDQFKTELLKQGVIEEMGRAGESPTKINGGYSIRLNESTTTQAMIVRAMVIDKDFIPSVNMKILYGRNINEGDLELYKADTTVSFIVNESTAQQLGVDPEKIVDMVVTLNGRVGPVRGVVQDFHFSSMHEPIRPLVLFTEPIQNRFIFLRLAVNSPTASIKQVESVFKELFPHRPFEFEFLDDQYQALYDKETRMGRISMAFSILAIVIACLGLLGLVAFAAAQKTKEIGIRKVMGASVTEVVLLLTKDFTSLVLIAIVIGVPFAYWILNSVWLSSFAYRIDIGILPGIIGATGCLLITWGVSVYQAYKAATIHPSQSLRSE